MDKLIELFKRHWLLIGVIMLFLLGTKGLALVALIMYILA